MEQNLMDTLKAIYRTAEIVLEHQSSKPFKNSIITVGVESIISMSKGAIEELEKKKTEG